MPEEEFFKARPDTLINGKKKLMASPRSMQLALQALKECRPPARFPEYKNWENRYNMVYTLLHKPF